MKPEDLAAILQRIRRRRPIVYNYANIVTANDCANATLAIGASPVMGLEEETDLVTSSNALVINIGTATKEIAGIMETAALKATDKGIPVVLDPVGAGASRFRTDLSIRLIDKVHPIIRCNYSEFLTIAGIRSETRGVDSIQNDFFDTGVISSLAKALGTVIAVTGQDDIISDGNNIVTIHNGNEKMENISGTGCMCSSLVGAAVAVADTDKEYLQCVSAAIAIMGICGEKSAERFRGTNTMRGNIIDNLSTVDTAEFLQLLSADF